MQILRGPENFHRLFLLPFLRSLKGFTGYDDIRVFHSPYFKITSHNKIDSSLAVYIEVFLNVGKL